MRNERPIDYGFQFPDEIAHLSEVGRKLENALRMAEKEVDQIGREYMDAKRYMVEYRGEIDPHEMFQNELLLKQTDQRGAISMDLRDRLAKLKASPYFARIDFLSEDSMDAEICYIGRFTFSYEQELLIFDWRAPIASMFYDDEIGPAGYDAPIGRIDGELTRKRQFKIKNGALDYALESSAYVQDDILQKELSHTSDEKMKSIISTIQKEQNQIIRNENAETLIIQGVAGSGKTSIALHRIAFLLYQWRDRLNARNVTILSPNKVFGDYIGGVIPELGEEPIYEMSFADIAEILLEHVIVFEPDKDLLETQDKKWQERVRFKSTLEFVRLLEDYLDSLPDRIFAPEQIAFGRFSVDSAWLRERFRAYGNYPVKQRISRMAEDIYNRFQDDNFMQDELPKVRTIKKSLTAMLRVKNTLALYKDFYQALGKPEMFLMPKAKTLEWADAAPFLYLHAAFEDLKVSGVTKHLVIDEMQDYTPIQYAVLNRLFPCQKTILGDFSQVLNPYHQHTLTDIRQLYEGAEFVELNKSYRSTYEIMTFAKRIQNITALDAVERQGEEPALIACEDVQDEIQQLKKAILKFEAGESALLGIILKTNKAAKMLYELLRAEFDINLISPESICFAAGVSVTSIQMAKGLEFDEVIVPQADSVTYASDYDRSLLYIACTRAMHRLTLLYMGNPSPFLVW